MAVKIHTVVVGPVQTNCYLVTNEENLEAICFDPGDRAGAIIEKVLKEGLKLVGVMLTHGHFDHILAAKQVSEYFKVKIYANEHEKSLLLSPELNMSTHFIGEAVSLQADEWLTDQEELVLAGLKVRAIATPGHTGGGMCYYFPEEELLISGDTLFCGSTGRTDFPTGDYRALVSSIKQKLFVLPDQTKVLPGHDCDTTIGNEKEEF